MKLIQDAINELGERIKGRVDVVVAGKCKSFEEYKALTGEIQGLLAGQIMLTDLVRKLENDDDE